jgi:hypothetical protein
VRSRLWLFAVVAAVVAGALARAACLSAEFWLDEIWSLEFARAAKTPFDVLFATKHDNNHHLNTLFLYFCPDGVWWGWYRLHSLLAGTASIAVAAKVARRWGRTEAVVAAWLVAGCSWLILASAEARGYALCVLFALIAFDALWGYLDTRSPWSLAVYWAATVLGFLSHLTFVYATMGFVVWSLRRFARERSSPGSEVRQLLLTHGPPGLLVVAFYVVAVRGMEKGGGPPASTFEVLGSLIGHALGGPAGWWSLPWVLVAMILFVRGAWQLWREGSDLWVFFLTTCVLAPGLYLVFRPLYLFERYFFVPLTFFLLLAAYAQVRAGMPLRGSTPEPAFDREAAEHDRRSAASSVILLLIFLMGNGDAVWKFTKTGRGDFHEALAWVLAEDHGAVVRVTSEHEPKDDHGNRRGAPFRTEKYVSFYARQLAPDRDVRFVDADAQWLFVHRIDDSQPPDEVRDADGNVYELAKSFPSRGPGAWGWFVYRRVQ